MALTRSEQGAVLLLGQGEALHQRASPATGKRALGLPRLRLICAGTRPEGQQPKTAPDVALLDFFSSARRRLSRTKGSRDRRQPTRPAMRSLSACTIGDGAWPSSGTSSPSPLVLLHDSTVQAIAARRPATTEELLTVPGLGPVKVARYGSAILELVQAC